MEAANPESYRHINRILSSASSSSTDSGAFSDCNSDRSGDFPLSRRLSVLHYSDDLALSLISDLSSPSLAVRRTAAMEIRLLAKHDDPASRLRLARLGAVPPLVALISSPDRDLQEHAVTAVLNLSLLDENKPLISSAGAIRPLVRALKAGSTSATRENAACALLRLSQGGEEHRAAIGRAGAIPLLVELLEVGGSRAKKDAAAALYALCSGSRENGERAVRAGVARPLLELMADPENGMVDKAVYVMAAVVKEGGEEAWKAVVEEGGVPVLVELVEAGSRRQKEMSCEVLFHICQESNVYRKMVVREGAVPPLIDLSQTATSKGKKKAEALIALLRQ